MEVDDIVKLSDQLFGKRQSLLSLWQEIAEQFYPERADFTSMRYLGEEMTQNLTTSYPLLARRELGNTFSAMLRPKDRDWFMLQASREEAEGLEEQRWLEWAVQTQRRAMYDRLSGFTRATKQADHDFATFGQCVISLEMSRDRSRLLYRNWHLRDTVWRENEELQIDTIFRKWKAPAADLVATFGERAGPKVQEAINNKEPFKEFDCLHAILPSEGRVRQPYESVYLDAGNKHVMERTGSWSKIYIIPRWQTVSGSQYAHSPAVVAALPDARLIQSISLTLLDAGEMYAAPPMLAVKDVIRGDIDLRSRGITWVDADYDERLGEALRPLSQDSRGYPIGDVIREEARQMIAEAFFINKLQLPEPTGREMTAYEVAQRVQEFVRTTLPLFEPIEDDYNGALCDETFQLGLRQGMFGPLDAIPEGLRGTDIEFRFISPLSEARDREKGARFMEARNMLGLAAEMQQLGQTTMNVNEALRDALKGVGVPADWMYSEDEEAELIQRQQQAQQAQQVAAGVERVAQVGEQMGKAGQAIQQLETAA
jgi:hypothetical protein